MVILPIFFIKKKNQCVSCVGTPNLEVFISWDNRQLHKLVSQEPSTKKLQGQTNYSLRKFPTTTTRKQITLTNQQAREGLNRCNCIAIKQITEITNQEDRKGPTLYTHLLHSNKTQIQRDNSQMFLQAIVRNSLSPSITIIISVTI